MSRPGLRSLLVASLALNLFLAGAFASHWAGRLFGPGGFGPPGPPPGPAPFAPPPPPVLRSLLAETDRPVLDAVKAEHDPAVRAAFREMEGARARVRQALQAEPFDAAALSAAFADLRRQEEAVASAVQAMLTDLLGRLEPAARRRIAEAWERPGPGGPPPGPPPGERQPPPR